jgi:hypothetical protein
VHVVDAAPVERLQLADPQPGHRGRQVHRAVDGVMRAGPRRVDERPDLVAGQVSDLRIRRRLRQVDVRHGVPGRPPATPVAGVAVQAAQDPGVVAHALAGEPGGAHARDDVLDVVDGHAVQGPAADRRQPPTRQSRPVRPQRRRLGPGGG